MPEPKKPAATPPASADDQDDLEPSRTAGGMITEAEFEVQATEVAKKRAAEIAARDPDDVAVGDERLRALKAEARKKIDEAIVAKRKRRRLLKGGDVSH